jgi:REP-associated tyrosine transposase
MYNHYIHDRRSIRLKNYDYSSAGFYFITLCTLDRKNIFGEIIKGAMHLNQFGKIAAEEWEKTPEIRKNISLGGYIFMPNHFHGIISIDYKIIQKGKDNIGKFHSPSQTIGAIIRGFKGATTKRINNLLRELREKSGSTGESQFALLPDKSASTGDSGPTGESQFASTDKSARTGESQSASTIYNLSGQGSIWQRNYYENIIRNEKAYFNISTYIINNPKNWDKDKFK